MDSFFSSVALFEYLREHDTLAVGTVIAGRVGVPRTLHPKELKLKKGESQFRRKGYLLCLRVNDRKNVLLLSTKHMAAPPPNNGQESLEPTTKPVVILDYNQHINGYRMLKKIFVLPSVSTLKRSVRNIYILVSTETFCKLLR